MSTNGNWGFRKNGVEKITYRHYDSYPKGLGNEIVILIKCSLGSMDDMFEKIQITQDETDCLTPIEVLKRYNRKQNSIKIFGHNNYKSKYMEYAYIVDLDTLKLEIYNYGEIIQVMKLNEVYFF